MKENSVTRFLGLNAGTASMLAIIVFVGMGEKMAERFLPVYIMSLGGGTLAIGIFGGLTNFVAALYSLPGGFLADRLGYKRSILLFNLISIAGYLIALFAPSWPFVILGALFFLSWSSISLPATMGIISKALPESKRTMGVALNSLVRRFPRGLGPLLGGVLITAYGETDGVRYAFMLAILLAVIAIIIQQRFLPEDVSQPHLLLNLSYLKNLYSRMTPQLKRLLLSDILVRFCEQIPYAFVVVWCLKEISSPITAAEFGILTAIEMAVAALIYIPIAHLADKTEKTPFVIVTFGFFTLFPIVLLFSHSFWPLVGAFVIRGLKEFGEPSRKALILDLCPSDQRAAMFGLYYLIRDLVVSIAAFSGAWFWDISPQTNLIVAAGFGILSTFLYLIAEKKQKG